MLFALVLSSARVLPCSTFVVVSSWRIYQLRTLRNQTNDVSGLTPRSFTPIKNEKARRMSTKTLNPKLYYSSVSYCLP